MTKERVVTIDDKPENSAVKDAPVAVSQVISGAADSALSGKRTKITIYEQDTDLGKLDVTLGLNGIAYKIKRNEVVDVPSEIVGVLRDAVEEVFEAQGGAVIKRQRPRFSFQVHA